MCVTHIGSGVVCFMHGHTEFPPFMGWDVSWYQVGLSGSISAAKAIKKELADMHATTHRDTDARGKKLADLHSDIEHVHKTASSAGGDISPSNNEKIKTTVRAKEVSESEVIGTYWYHQCGTSQSQGMFENLSVGLTL